MDGGASEGSWEMESLTIGTRVTPPIGLTAWEEGHTRGPVAQGWVWRVVLFLTQAVEEQVAERQPQLISPSTRTVSAP